MIYKQTLLLLVSLSGLINCMQLDPQKQLKDAINNGEVETIKELIKSNPDLNLDNQLLRLFLKYEDYPDTYLPRIKTVIDSGANVNQQDKDGDTLLHQDYNLTEPELIEYLLTVPSIKPLIRNNLHETPIDVAYKKIREGTLFGDLYFDSIKHIAKFILTKKTDRINEQTELIAAINAQNVTKAEKLIHRNYAFAKAYRDKNGNNIMHIATFAKTPSIAMVKKILSLIPSLAAEENNEGIIGIQPAFNRRANFIKTFVDAAYSNQPIQ